MLHSAELISYWTSSCNLCLFVCTDLADLLLGGFEGLDDAVQLDTTREQALLQLGLLLLQPAQVCLGAAQFILLAAEVWLLRADLALQGRNLEQREKSIFQWLVHQLHNSCTFWNYSCAVFLVCLLGRIKAALIYKLVLKKIKIQYSWMVVLIKLTFKYVWLDESVLHNVIKAWTAPLF